MAACLIDTKITTQEQVKNYTLNIVNISNDDINDLEDMVLHGADFGGSITMVRF
jgi:hypothetical protein